MNFIEKGLHIEHKAWTHVGKNYKEWTKFKDSMKTPNRRSSSETLGPRPIKKGN